MKNLIFMLLLVTNIFGIDYGDLPKGNFISTWHEIKPELGGTWDTVKVSDKGILPGEVGSKFQDLIDNHTKPTVYVFDEGTYKFDASILIKVNHVNNDFLIIKGAGSSKTKFLFDCDVDYFGALIWAESKSAYGDRDKPISLSIAPKAGDNKITLSASSSDLEVGGLVCVKQDNPQELMFPDGDKDEAWYIKWQNGKADWSAESYGEFNKITSVNGNQVTLENPIVLDYSSSENPRVSIYPKKDIVQNVGVEGLYIEHVISDSRYTAGGVNDIFDIAFRFATNCFVNDVYSYNTARGHVISEYTYNVSVVNSHFAYARNYGIGGAGYGVCVQNRSANNYIANNEFEHLRHAVVLKEGASHTVVAYNWSHDWAILDPSVVDENGDKIDAEADLSIHGFYSHSNLFEGNVCHNIFYADYWGPTGPRTVAYRNRIYGLDSLDGIYVDDYSHGESVIANIIPGLGQLNVSPEIKNTYKEGNIINGETQWNTLSDASDLPNSLYLSDKPYFWDNSYAYPPFGPDIAGTETNEIPAMSEVQLSVKHSTVANKKTSLSIYPNPFNPVTTINFNTNNINSSVKVYDIKGREIMSKNFSRIGQNSMTFNGTKQASGIYFVKAMSGTNIITKKMILIK